MRWPWQKSAKQVDTTTVMPRLKTPGFVMATMNLPHDQRPIAIPFVGDLLVAYAVDEGEHFRYLTRAEVDAMPNGESGLQALAVDNLADFIQRPDHLKLENVDGSLTRATIPDGLTASLLLVDDFWKHGLERIGPVAAIVPSRDELWFGPATTEGNVERLAKLVSEREFGHTHALVPHLLNYSSKGWEAYQIG
ncbi:hypothetical protein BH10PSE17_BH10PSE17_01620 [soil metagenome]